MRVIVTFVTDLIGWLVRVFPTSIGKIMRRAVYSKVCKSFGKQADIAENVTVGGFKNISLGNKLIIFKSSYLYAEDGELIIGDHVGINSNVLIDASQGRIIIGAYCLIGPNCVLRAADHRYEDVTTPISLQAHEGGEIIIEDDVWLASNVVVTRGVRIGKGSVVGAQSIVTHDLPPYSVAFGNPAQVVRKRGEGSSPSVKPSETSSHG